MFDNLGFLVYSHIYVCTIIDSRNLSAKQELVKSDFLYVLCEFSFNTRSTYLTPLVLNSFFSLSFIDFQIIRDKEEDKKVKARMSIFFWFFFFYNIYNFLFVFDKENH